MKDIHKLLDKLEAAECAFSQSAILAPVLPGQAVAVRIAGVVTRLWVDDPQYCGWAILGPAGSGRARIMREATLAEVSAYLRVLPAVRLIVIVRGASYWQAYPAQKGDRRLRLSPPVPVWLTPENLHPFETVLARFDGCRFWCERLDKRRPPALASYLRESLNGQLPPERLHKRGLSAEEREAYAWIWQSLERARRRPEEIRLGDALAHADARLLSYIERADAYTVTYRVKGRDYTSTVSKEDLTVLTSGICLSDRDRDFDLTSLVGVMGEAQREGMAG